MDIKQIVSNNENYKRSTEILKWVYIFSYLHGKTMNNLNFETREKRTKSKVIKTFVFLTNNFKVIKTLAISEMFRGSFFPSNKTMKIFSFKICHMSSKRTANTNKNEKLQLTGVEVFQSIINSKRFKQLRLLWTPLMWYVTSEKQVDRK